MLILAIEEVGEGIICDVFLSSSCTTMDIMSGKTFSRDTLDDRYQWLNQMSYIEGQIIQWPKENEQGTNNDLQYN